MAAPFAIKPFEFHISFGLSTGLGAIFQLRTTVGASAVNAAKDLAFFLDAMTNDPAATMRTSRRERVDGAFETVKSVTLSADDDFETLIVIVAADFAFSHGN